MVQRTALVARLNKEILRKLTLVSAPAGYGKTTLLGEWIDQTQLPITLISLDVSDNDPIYFMRYVIAALQRLEPKIGETSLTLLQSQQKPALEAIIINLIQEMDVIPNDFVLILDDYHFIDTVKIHQLIEFLIDRMPSLMHLVIATRVDPSLPLARLRVRNQLNEFRIADLCFTRKETAQFFKKVLKLNLSDQDIATLESRTEGWVAGLQLAGLSMQGRSDIPDFIKEFAGDNRLIVDYLVEEVLTSQPPDVQDFLLQTSILNRLSEPLCDYVTDQKDSQKILEDLEISNLFLVPLDSKRQWYRYHHLFADLLRQKLYQKGHDVVGRLHSRASEWFETNGIKEEAIEHALAAREFVRAAGLIEAYILERWLVGEQVVLFNWLDQLPDEIKLIEPNLGLYHAQVLFQSGRHVDAEERIDQVERAHVIFPERTRRVSNRKPETSGDSEITKLQGRIAAIRTYMATHKGDISGIAEYSRQALAYLSKEDLTWRAMVSISTTIVHEIRGDAIASIDAHSEAADAAKKAGNVYLYLIERLWLAIVLKNAGRLPKAMKICRQLLNETNDETPVFNAAIGGVWAAWGEILYELYDLDEAHRYAKKGVELLEQSHDLCHLGWPYSCLAKILCSKQNLVGAEEIISKIETLLQTTVIPPWQLTQVNAVKARVYMMKGDMVILQRWINDCGLKLNAEPTILHEPEYMMFSRILIAQGRFNDALGLLNRLITEEENTGRVLNQIETLVLKALALNKLKKETESVSAVEKALELAEPGGYSRIFIDEGPPMAELLEKMLDTRKTIHRAFVKKLLPAFKLRKIVKTENGLVEQLSRRELEVLKFIAAGMSNLKITEQLFISMSTVKTHLRNIYDKLGVHSRTEAIAKARDIGLL